MRHGLEVGQTAEIEIVVTPQMAAQFEDQLVHNLYSTSALVHHMEWAARKTILPYLEPGEEGMGAHVEVAHLMMTPVGMTVRVKATVTGVTESRVDCHVRAFNERGTIAKGQVVQAIVDRVWLKNKIQEMSLINKIGKGEKDGKAGCAV